MSKVSCGTEKSFRRLHVSVSAEGELLGPGGPGAPGPVTMEGVCRCYGKPSLCCPLLEEMEKNITGFYHRGPGEGQPHLRLPGLRGPGDFKVKLRQDGELQEGNLGWLRSRMAVLIEAEKMVLA
ncbi:hypothetical protein NHX12_000273, partial [Muraenolepis orangiensis]